MRRFATLDVNNIFVHKLTYNQLVSLRVDLR